MNRFLRRIDQWRLLLETGVVPGMAVPGLIYADDYIESLLKGEDALSQVANVACLPGIVGYSMAMPDIHQGYGFPIGGVAAFDVSSGVISPGGVGYDISCGVRLLASKIPAEEFRPRADRVLAALFSAVPCGVGSVKDSLGTKEVDRILEEGAVRVVRSGRERKATSGGRRKGDASWGPSRAPFLRGQRNGAKGSSAPWVQAITLSKSRKRRNCSSPKQRPPWGFPKDASP